MSKRKANGDDQVISRVQALYRGHRVRMWKTYFTPIAKLSDNRKNLLNCDFEKYFNNAIPISEGVYGQVKLHVFGLGGNNKSAFALRNKYSLLMPRMVVKKFARRDGALTYALNEYNDHRQLWNRIVNKHKNTPNYRRKLWLTKPLAPQRCGRDVYLGSEYVDGPSSNNATSFADKKPETVGVVLKRLKKIPAFRRTDEDIETISSIKKAILHILDELASFGYYHEDLHGGNLLYDPGVSRTVPVRLIDINLGRLDKNGKVKRNKNSWDENLSEWLRIVLKKGYQAARDEYPDWMPFWAVIDLAQHLVPRDSNNNTAFNVYDRHMKKLTGQGKKSNIWKTAASNF